MKKESVFWVSSFEFVNCCSRLIRLGGVRLGGSLALPNVARKIAGHIDLSVGSVAGFIGALASLTMVRSGMNFLLATVLCLGAGAAIGAAQGYWIAYHKIPSFIVTLAGTLVFRGLTLALLGGNSIGPFPVQFQLLSSGFIPIRSVAWASARRRC